MDLRERKTKRSIRNAFIQLRKVKPVERITVKELADLAEISKATFYLHYRDIFDLNDTLQEELLQKILSEITHPETLFSDTNLFTTEFCRSFYVHQEMIDILFSGNQSVVLPVRIEKELRNFIHKMIPTIDPIFDMLLTYQIQGGFFVSQKYHSEYGMEAVIQFLSSISKVTTDFFGETLDFSSSH